MADGVFNISKGSFVEKIRDSATPVYILLMQLAETETTLADYDDLAALFIPAGNTEADFATYARKTTAASINATITVDDTNDRVDVDMDDQTWTAATAGNTLVKLVTYYEESASEAGRVPLTFHDFNVTTDGSDITAQVNAAGFGRAA